MLKEDMLKKKWQCYCKILENDAKFLGLAMLYKVLVLILVI